MLVLPSHCWDIEIFDLFLEDFEEWTSEMFMRLQKNYKKDIKRVLRWRRVCTGGKRGMVVDQVVKLQRGEPFDWEEEVDESNFLDEDFHPCSEA